MKRGLKKRKKSFDSPCIFMCGTLLSHFASLKCMCVCVCVHVRVCVCASKPYHHTAVFSFVPVISLCLCLRPSFPCHLPFSQSCHTALLPYLVIPLKIFHCNTPTHASRNGKVTSLTRNMKLCAAAVTPNLFPYPLVCHIKNTQPGYKRAKSTNCSVWHLLPHKAKK